MSRLFASTLAFSFTMLALMVGSPVRASETEIAPQQQMKSLGFLRPSFYWVAMEPKNKDPKTKKLLDQNGSAIAAVSEKFYKKLLMEGTAKLTNGKVINYHFRIKRPDGTTDFRWRICPPTAPFGYGLDDIPLEPFRSVAVDITVIPLHSKVYIPAAKGTKLPDGTIHDGYFTAVDIGDLIKNKKIDIFTSFGDQSSVFYANGMATGKMVEVFIVQ